MSAEGISELLDQVDALAASAENHERRALLAQSSGAFPRVPGRVACLATPGPSFWARLLGYSVREFYTRPEVYLEQSLRARIYQFTELPDDAPIGRGIGVSLGSSFPSSLFGLATVYTDDLDPWLGREPVIREPDDLERLALPDFHASGLLPLAHRFYRRIRELVGDRVPVTFPDLGRGPFGLAWPLRSGEQLMLDMLADPPFAHRLFRLMTDGRMHYERERARFLGQPVGPGQLRCDEVNVPCLSPQLYREFVLPYELELREFHGGITYYHSCGNLTPLLPYIRELDPETLHVSPFTDLREALRLFGDCCLEVWLHPAEDVLRATEDEMARRLSGIVELCEAAGVHRYTIRTGHVQVMYSVEHTLAQLRTWIRVAKCVTGRAVVS